LKLRNGKKCGQPFSSKFKLKRHQRSLIHTTDKPYACPDCGQRFNRKDAMKRHHKAKNCKEVSEVENSPSASSAESDSNSDMSELEKSMHNTTIGEEENQEEENPPMPEQDSGLALDDSNLSVDTSTQITNVVSAQTGPIENDNENKNDEENDLVSNKQNSQSLKSNNQTLDAIPTKQVEHPTSDQTNNAATPTVETQADCDNAELNNQNAADNWTDDPDADNNDDPTASID